MSIENVKKIFRPETSGGFEYVVLEYVDGSIWPIKYAYKDTSLGINDWRFTSCDLYGRIGLTDCNHPENLVLIITSARLESKEDETNEEI